MLACKNHRRGFLPLLGKRACAGDTGKRTLWGWNRYWCKVLAPCARLVLHKQHSNDTLQLLVGNRSTQTQHVSGVVLTGQDSSALGAYCTLTKHDNISHLVQQRNGVM